ncbi:isocitrate lyase/phosphoenolpyruvate mutase family protein [Nonomuraea sp. 10N515B]|uniref:isocitrate lyase/phosphoenolpyruvate mutase family protein n=1 Tax=Nonomuraea sp. 10N515B TaxID=3457422 RepID=UPI003FCC75C8
MTDQAALFRALHHGGAVLVLPNAWDAASAAVIEGAGAQAIATTSAGVSWANGAPDAHGLSRERMAAAVGRIVAATVRAVIEAGAVGVNLEDSGGAPLLSPKDQARRIAEARAAAGVTRVSVGSAIAQSAYACAARAAAELLGAGTYDTLADGLDYGGLNAALST